MDNVIRINEWKEANKAKRAPKCTMCNADNPSHCATCASSSYCSKDCQKADWSLHKTFCKGFKLFPVLRPDAFHKIGLLFPVDEERPKLIWIPTTRQVRRVEVAPDTTALYLETFKNMGSFIGDGAAGSWLIERNILRGFKLTHELVFTYCKDHESQPINKSILKIMKGEVGEEGELGEFWKGPIVVTRQINYGNAEGTREDADEAEHILRLEASQQVEDMTLADLRHAADFFVKFPEVWQTKVEMEG